MEGHPEAAPILVQVLVRLEPGSMTKNGQNRCQYVFARVHIWIFLPDFRIVLLDGGAHDDPIEALSREYGRLEVLEAVEIVVNRGLLVVGSADAGLDGGIGDAHWGNRHKYNK